jgi:hypothetical protein
MLEYRSPRFPTKAVTGPARARSSIALPAPAHPGSDTCVRIVARAGTPVRLLWAP